MISLNRKHELFRQYKNGIVTFGHYNSFKNNFTTTLHLAKNSYFQRKFIDCSNNSRDTWKTLNYLIRCKKTSKDVTLGPDFRRVVMLRNGAVRTKQNLITARAVRASE